MSLILTKQPAESRLFDFDFSGKTRISETIVGTPTVTATPSGLTVGTTTASGVVGTVRLSSGVSGVNYKVTCTVTTNQSNTLELDSYLRVRDL